MTETNLSKITFAFKLSWNESSYRPSAPLRLVFGTGVFALVFTLGQLVYAIGATLVAHFPPFEFDNLLIIQLITMVNSQLIGSVSWVLGFLVAAWFLDRRYLSDMGLQINREWISEFSVGFLLGIALQAGILFLGLAAGWLTITGRFTEKAGQAFIPWLITMFVFYLCIGVREEILFRGFLMTNLAEGLLWFDDVNRSTAVWIAIAISSVCFGLWHWGRSVGFLVFAIVFGLLFGLSYALTDSVALAIGLHTAWNMAETSIFASHALPTSKLVEVTPTDPIVFVGG